MSDREPRDRVEEVIFGGDYELDLTPRAARPSPADPRGEDWPTDKDIELQNAYVRINELEQALAAADPSPTTSREGLREALDWLRANWTAGLSGDGFLRWMAANELARRHVRAALRAASPSPQPDPVGLADLHHSPRCPAQWRCRLPLRGERNASHVSYDTAEERAEDIAAHFEIYSGTAEELRALSSQEPTPAEPDR